MWPPDPRYMMPVVHQPRRLSGAAITFWSLAGGSIILFLVGVVLLLAVQPSSIDQFACGLGYQPSCNQLQIVGLIRIFAFFGTLAGLVCFGLFLVLALVTSFR